MPFLERKDYNKVISVKLVIPCGCNANCSFCYNKKNLTVQYDKQSFLKNFIPSLERLLKAIGKKNPVSLDITGGEPTFDTDLLSLILIKLRSYISDYFISYGGNSARCTFENGSLIDIVCTTEQRGKRFNHIMFESLAVMMKNERLIACVTDYTKE